MKAIQTIYKGRRFRSRLEARWAIFFDAIDIGWEYETEGFHIGETRYLTDFKLQSFGKNKVDAYVEVKPNRPTVEEIQKCYEVATGTKINMIIICGSPGLPQFSSLGIEWHLKSGYVAIDIPGEVQIKGEGGKKIPYPLWAESSRLSLFQTGPNGYSLDIWPIYWLIEELEDGYVNYTFINRVLKNTENLFGLTTFGSIMRSHYFSLEPKGRLCDHERLIYGYQLATCARFEHDEFNQQIVDGFYRDLELIPVRKVYSQQNNAYALYYDTASKNFISRLSSEAKPNGVLTLVKRSPKLIIKQFVLNYPKRLRTSDKNVVMSFWKGFLFRYRIRLKDLKLKRII